MKLVLLPGLDGTGALFKPFIDSLPPEIEPLVVSYPPDEKLSYGELSNHVMSQLPKDEEYLLIGESFSGPIAYDIALYQPENLKSVIFVATFLNNPRPTLLSLFKPLPKSLLLSLAIPTFLARVFLLGAGASNELISLFKQSLGTVTPGVLSFRLREITNLRKKPQRCDFRSTYIQAVDDKLIPEKCVEDFKEVMKNLSVFPVRGPHFILQANPSACAEIVANEFRLITNQSSTPANIADPAR